MDWESECERASMAWWICRLIDYIVSIAAPLDAPTGSICLKSLQSPFPQLLPPSPVHPHFRISFPFSFIGEKHRIPSMSNGISRKGRIKNG